VKFPSRAVAVDSDRQDARGSYRSESRRHVSGSRDERDAGQVDSTAIQERMVTDIDFSRDEGKRIVSYQPRSHQSGNGIVRTTGPDLEYASFAHGETTRPAPAERGGQYVPRGKRGRILQTRIAVLRGFQVPSTGFDMI
jgi:hypothetical protein